MYIVAVLCQQAFDLVVASFEKEKIARVHPMSERLDRSLSNNCAKYGYVRKLSEH